MGSVGLARRPRQPAQSAAAELAEPRTSAFEPNLRRYMALVTLLSLPVWFLAEPGIHHPDLVGTRTAAALLAVMTVLGELVPVKVPRGRQAGDEITVSSTFGMALLLVAPLGIVLLVQTTGLLIDEVVRRKRWSRLPFNVAQYAIAFGAARAVLVASGFGDRVMVVDRPASFLAAYAMAGAAFFVLNNGLTGVAVALKLRAPIWHQLLDDVRWDAAVHVPLIGLAPVVNVVLGWTAWGLLPLLAPVFAVHNSGRIAMRREFEALHDTLTGLPNRALLGTAINRLVATAEAVPVALLLLDLDHFKEINDTLGHQAGDDVLREVTRRLRAEIGDTGVLARLGGDEFAVVAPIGEHEACALAARVIAAIGHGLVVGDVHMDIRVSVGIGLAPHHAHTSQALMRVADVALYRAKEDRNSYVLYDRASDTHTSTRLSLHLDLRHAVEAGTLQVAYQPQVDAAGALVGVECLARWRHPELGMVSPEVFIPIAEKTGLIEPLTEHVLRTACRQVLAWQADGLDLTVAVNLSARQLIDQSLPDRVGRVLAEMGFPAERMVLEVTESSVMKDPDAAATVITALRSLGIGISIDDFGTGYSALSYLTTLEIDELKIDRSFVTHLLATPKNQAVVHSTVLLAHELGLRVVAEGVENDGTLAVLSQWGCDLMQGFRIAPPMDAAALPTWDRSRQASVEHEQADTANVVTLHAVSG